MAPWNSTSGVFAFIWQRKSVGIIMVKAEKMQICFKWRCFAAVSLDLNVPNKSSEWGESSHQLVRSGDSCLQGEFWSHSIVGLMMWLLVVCGKNASHSFGFHWISKVEQNCTFVIWHICWTSEFIFLQSCNSPCSRLEFLSYWDTGWRVLLNLWVVLSSAWNPFLDLALKKP